MIWTLVFLLSPDKKQIAIEEHETIHLGLSIQLDLIHKTDCNTKHQTIHPTLVSNSTPYIKEPALQTIKPLTHSFSLPPPSPSLSPSTSPAYTHHKTASTPTSSPPVSTPHTTHA